MSFAISPAVKFKSQKGSSESMDFPNSRRARAETVMRCRGREERKVPFCSKKMVGVARFELATPSPPD